MHGLAHYATRLGLAPKEQPTYKFSQRFWDNLVKKGRINELKLGVNLYFMNGFSEGVKTALKMAPVGLGMLKTKRMSPMEMVGGHSIKDIKGFHAMLKKAEELESARVDANSGSAKNA
jgi:quinone-modifying oxidoreductase subunit QmoC